MAAPRSAGVLLYRRVGPAPEVLLVLPGGPFWRGRDVGAWQIPKGAIEPGEDARAAALREVKEELGVSITAPLHPLARIRQAGGKWVEAYTAEQDVDAGAIVSITFELEWPPRSGRLRAFPEVAAARWLPLATAATLILPSQAPLLAAITEFLQSAEPAA